jgi:hypothetical protein
MIIKEREGSVAARQWRAKRKTAVILTSIATVFGDITCYN